MIMLDTNQLEHAQPPDGPLIAMLKTLAKLTNHGLWLPDIALEEHLAHYRREVQAAEHQRRSAEDELKRLVPYLRLQERPPFNIEPAVMDRTHQLQLTFMIFRTPDKAGRESVLREARRQPPATITKDGHGAGARDVAIWLTALHACEEHGEETYFVSADKKAFGEDVLKPELAAEVQSRLGERAARFHYCNGIDALLAKLATKKLELPGRAHIVAAEPVRDAIHAALGDPALMSELVFSAGLEGVVSSIPGVEKLLPIGTVGRVMAYQIGDSAWASARPSWRATKNFNVVDGPDPDWRARYQVAVTFTITTTVIMQLGEGGTITAAEVTARSSASGVHGVTYVGS